MSDALSPAFTSRREAPLLPNATRQHRSQSDFHGRAVNCVQAFSPPSNNSFLSAQRDHTAPSGLSLALSDRMISRRLLVGSQASLEAPSSVIKSLAGTEANAAPYAAAITFPDDDRALTVLCRIFPDQKPIPIPERFQSSADLTQHYTSLVQARRIANNILSNITPDCPDAISLISNIDHVINEAFCGDSESDIETDLTQLESALRGIRGNEKIFTAVENAARTSKENVKSAQSYVHTFINQNEKCAGLNRALIDVIVAAQSRSVTPAQSTDSQSRASTPIPIPYKNTYNDEKNAQLAITRLSEVLRGYGVFFGAYTTGSEILTELVQQTIAGANGLLCGAKVNE